VEYVVGDAAVQVEVRLLCGASINSNSARGGRVGIGVDSSTVFSGLHGELYNTNVGSVSLPAVALYNGSPGLGYHYLSWLEAGSDGVCVFIGDNAGADQFGLSAWIES
jgi:hypothetical protein